MGYLRIRKNKHSNNIFDFYDYNRWGETWVAYCCCTGSPIILYLVEENGDSYIIKDDNGRIQKFDSMEECAILVQRIVIERHYNELHKSKMGHEKRILHHIYSDRSVDRRHMEIFKR